MSLRRSIVAPLVVALAALALARTAAAKESGTFVIRLGQDTVSVETYLRAPTLLDVDQVGRSPRVLRRHYTYTLANGNVTRFALVVKAPGSDTPTQTIDAAFDADSFRTKTTMSGGAAPQVTAVKIPRGTLILANASPWSRYEDAIMKLAKGKADTLGTPLYTIGSSSADWLSLRKVGADSVAIALGSGNVYRARIDKSGHLLGVLPIRGTQQVTVDRVDGMEVGAMAASFAAREQSGGRMGALSPRDTVTATAGGASLWVDYSRPSKRGRVIFGTVVPFGEVWRTGANAATQFKTDKALDFGGTVVPAGFYSLWTVPAANGWKLIFNSETGGLGTEHKADKDLYTIAMKVSSLPDVVERFTIGIESTELGGTLDLDWDTTRASVAFTVKH
jgi:hypothetical protein